MAGLPSRPLLEGRFVPTMGRTCRNRRALAVLGIGLTLSGALLWLVLQKAPALPAPAPAEPARAGALIAVTRPAVAVQVLTTSPGMSAQAVEEAITSRIERWVNQAPGVTRIESKSIEGASLLTVHFRDDIDPNSALTVTNSLALEALPALPARMLPPVVLPCDDSHPREIGDMLKLLAEPRAAADRPRE
jgi:hypothetical protein